MGSAFTPGLTISDQITIRKKRRLPVKGQVIAKVGDKVSAETIVAKVDLPGMLAVAKSAAALGCSPDQLKNFCMVEINDTVKKDQVIAERKILFGLVTNKVKSPINGTIEYLSNLSGNIGVRGKPKPLSCVAYISGTIIEIIKDEGVVVETTGALIQGIFGIGGERHGQLVWIDEGQALTANAINESHRGQILMHHGRIDASAIVAAVEFGVIGLVGASIIDSELMNFLGFDIGVAITGEEDIAFSLMVTEGFGHLNMPERTENLLKTLSGSHAAINGATQIRAGVIRPELIVANNISSNSIAVDGKELKIGTLVRLIRRPNFGKIGVVKSLPEQPVIIDTGSHVRVTTITLNDGKEVTIPRANIEILD